MAAILFFVFCGLFERNHRGQGEKLMDAVSMIVHGLCFSLTGSPLLASCVSLHSLYALLQTDRLKGQHSKTSPMVSFQVYEPVSMPDETRNSSECVQTQLLMQHVFSNSYGHPFVGLCSLPRNTKCRFDTGVRRLHASLMRFQ